MENYKVFCRARFVFLGYMDIFVEIHASSEFCVRFAKKLI